MPHPCASLFIGIVAMMRFTQHGRQTAGRPVAPIVVSNENVRPHLDQRFKHDRIDRRVDAFVRLVSCVRRDHLAHRRLLGQDSYRVQPATRQGHNIEAECEGIFTRGIVLATAGQRIAADSTTAVPTQRTLAVVQWRHALNSPPHPSQNPCPLRRQRPEKAMSVVLRIGVHVALDGEHVHATGLRSALQLDSLPARLTRRWGWLIGESPEQSMKIPAGPGCGFRMPGRIEVRPGR